MMTCSIWGGCPCQAAASDEAATPVAGAGPPRPPRAVDQASVPGRGVRLHAAVCDAKGRGTGACRFDMEPGSHPSSEREELMAARSRSEFEPIKVGWLGACLDGEGGGYDK